MSLLTSNIGVLLEWRRGKHQGGRIVAFWSIVWYTWMAVMFEGTVLIKNDIKRCYEFGNVPKVQRKS